MNPISQYLLEGLPGLRCWVFPHREMYIGLLGSDDVAEAEFAEGGFGFFDFLLGDAAFRGDFDGEFQL